MVIMTTPLLPWPSPNIKGKRNALWQNFHSKRLKKSWLLVKLQIFMSLWWIPILNYYQLANRGLECSNSWSLRLHDHGYNSILRAKAETTKQQSWQTTHQRNKRKVAHTSGQIDENDKRWSTPNNELVLIYIPGVEHCNILEQLKVFEPSAKEVRSPMIADSVK